METCEQIITCARCARKLAEFVPVDDEDEGGEGGYYDFSKTEVHASHTVHGLGHTWCGECWPFGATKPLEAK